MNHPATAYLVEPLNSDRNRGGFNSGVPALDRYLREQAGQDSRKHVTAVYLLIHRASGMVAGFYTLANTGLAATELPPELLKKLPRYPVLPATLIGRLAMDVGHRGKGLGAFLLTDAMRRSLELSQSSASFAVLVDAKDDRAADFYLHFGFERIVGISDRLFMTMQEIAHNQKQTSQSD